MRRNRRKRKLNSEINVVPYIDVMLVLLIIFMVTAPLLTQGVKVSLPKAQAKSMAHTKNTPVVITINKTGHYYLNIADSPKKPVNQNEMIGFVKAALARDSKRKVYVRGDRDVDYGKVVGAMVLLQKAGAKTVGLITQLPNSKT